MKKVLLLFVAAGILTGAYFLGYPMYKLHYNTLNLSSDTKEVFVPTGCTMTELSELVTVGSDWDKVEFLDFADKLEFDESDIEPGKYSLTNGQTKKSVIYGFKNGNQEIKDVRITFNNCKTIEDMAGKVAPFIEADSAEIADYALNPSTIDHYGFNDATAIAMYIPDTYEIGEWDVTAEEFIQFMADKYKEYWEGEGRQAKLAERGMQQSEVATLATIVMAEQGKFEQEWKTIAGLYLNRLEQGIKLQSDPTAKYCWGDELAGVQRILYEHLEKDCPYNTYLYKGLPPGPLRMPSKTALDAVLFAEDHEYIYMCARPDNSGLHNFAETLAQHNENARKFRKWMDEQGL